jgi:hypothetical protein
VRIYEGAGKFSGEFKEQIAIAITSAFAFLVALSWRSPIEKGVNYIIERLGLEAKGIFIEFLSALVITLIAVIFLMYFSRWKKSEK